MKPLPAVFRCREALGLAVGLLMLLTLPWRIVMIVEPAWLLLVMLVLACMAGFAGGGIAVQHHSDPSRAIRFGAWTSFLTAVVSAAVFALVARLMESWVFIVKAGISGMLSLLPVTFYGMVCSGVAALTLVRGDAQSAQMEPIPPPSSGLVWTLRVLIALLVVSAVVLPPVSPQRLVVPQQLPSHQVQTAAPRPTFAFTPPPDIGSANAMQWRLINQREISGVDDSALVLSADDRYVACLSRDKQSIQVIDLRSEAVWRVNPPGNVEYLTFSPTGDRLLTVCHRENERHYSVADIRSGRVTVLPKPRRGMVPEGTPFWWKEKKVLIVQGQDSSILNLDTLEIDAAEQDGEWKALDPLIQKKVTREVVPALRDKLRWQWESRQIIRSSELPEIVGQTSWPLKSEHCLAIRHPEMDCMTAFPSLVVRDDDRLCSTRDGSVVLRAADGVLHLYYFNTEPAPDLVWKIGMPHPPEEGEHPEDVARALESGQLAALVYRPMLNPLNQQVVGPLRDDVLAVVRFLEWKGKEATVYLWQRSSPVKQGDIIADVCFLAEKPEGDIITLDTPHRWWTPLPAANGGGLAPPSTSSRRDRMAVVEKRDREEVTARTAREEAERKKQQDEMAAAARMAAEKAAAMDAERKAAEVKTADENKLKAEIEAFVRKHHQKSKDSDVTGMVSDYAVKVDYFDKGVVEQNWILEDEMKYHSTQVILDERIISDIVIRPDLKSGGYETLYDLRLHAQNITTNKVSGGDFATRLVIRPTAQGLKIMLHHSQRKP